MTKTGQVLLITGPAGSGKTSLGQAVSKKLGWQFVSEDTYWTDHGWSGNRSEQQEAVIQHQVNLDVLKLCRSGKSVVLEFILYKDPPNPLTTYQQSLAKNSISYTTIVLKPTVDEIMRRIQARGRSTDLADLSGRRLHAENQLSGLTSDYIKSEWLIDPTAISVDELVTQVVKIIESPKD